MKNKLITFILFTICVCTNLLATPIETGVVTNAVIKARPGFLNCLSVHNPSGSSQYVLIMDASSVPGNGSVTVKYPPIQIPANTTAMVVFPQKGLFFKSGISVCTSSTAVSGTNILKTLGTAASFTAQIDE